MMNELMTEPMQMKEVIDTLKGLAFGTFDRTTAKEREALDMAVKALKQQRWIPCSERLPGDCISVLICVKTPNGYFIDVSYRSGFIKWEKYGSNVNVIAWQPLPTPYKEGEE